MVDEIHAFLRLMQIQVQQNTAIFKRIASALVIVVIAVLAVNLWQMQKKNAVQWYQYESEQLGRSLTQQAAKLLSPPMQASETDILAYYVAMITQDEFVKGAVIFNANGKRLNIKPEDASVVDLVSQNNDASLIFVEDIINDNGDILGYIKLIINKQQVTVHHRNFVTNLLYQTIITITLTFIIAALIMRFYYKLRYRHLIGSEADYDEITER